MLNYHVQTQQQYVDYLVSIISSAEGHRQVVAFPPNDPCSNNAGALLLAANEFHYVRAA